MRSGHWMALTALLWFASAAEAQIAGYRCGCGWPYGYSSQSSRLTLTVSDGRFSSSFSVHRLYGPPTFGCAPYPGYYYVIPPVYYPPPTITVVQPIYVPVASADSFRPSLPPLGPGIAADRRVLEPEAEPLPPLPRPAPRGNADARDDFHWFITSGNEAFAAGDYRFALRRFQQAAAALPAEPLSLFLVAQAELALGNYDSAAKAIVDGLVKQPQWPLSDYQPRQLYAPNSRDFEKHLEQLAEASAKKPRDDKLLFLVGFQLWFDGRRDEALLFFKRAAAVADDTTAIDRFLKAARLPRGPVALDR